MAHGARTGPPPLAHMRVLDNGLKVLIREIHTAPLASVWCWYKVGSKDEGPGSTGISHWVEHMNFKGTANIPRGQMKGLIERFGGTWNGYTWVDQTAYFETAIRDALDEMLFIEAERMVNGLYHASDCESERSVIISELHGSENDPEQVLEIEVTATALKAHPYRHPTIGWLSDLETLTREDLYGYYRRFYVPHNATLVIVGDVETDEVLRRVEQRFGRYQPGPELQRRYSREPAQIGERRVSIVREGTAAYVKIAHHGPAVTDDDFAAMLVLDAVLTGAKGLNLWSSFRGTPPQRTSRLYQALVERRLASAVSGALLPTAHPYLYTVTLTVAEGADLDEVQRVVLDELDQVRRLGVTPEHLERARRQLRARLVFENDSVTNIAHQIGFFETVAQLDVLPALSARISAVTADQVGQVAARYLGSQTRTVGVLRPSSPPSGVPANGPRVPGGTRAPANWPVAR